MSSELCCFYYSFVVFIVLWLQSSIDLDWLFTALVTADA